MNLSYYAFALFVFLLVCVVVWFFSKVYRGTKKEENNDYAKEQRLFKLYQNVEDMMNSFEEYIEESRTELDQKITEISEMLDLLKIKPQKKQKSEEMKLSTDEKSVETTAKTKMKNEEFIAQLLDTGMDINEIAKKFGMSKREVSLIMDIKKIKTSRKNP